MGHKRFNLALLVWLALLAATICHAQPTITTTQLPYAQVNLPYNATLNATGGTPPYTWSIVAGALPPGLSLSPAGAISGTSAGPSSGFTVQVTDANFPQSPPAQGFFFISFCGTTVNPASQGHTFEDPGGSDVLSVNSPCGALTPGATVPWINITGIVNGDGFDNINISVASNATLATRTGNVTFTYNQVSPVLVLSYTITQYAKLRFSTPSPLPLGEVGVPYSAALQATGGSGIGRSFAIASGSLPPGLGLSGATISGTPTLPGVSSFTAQVTDQDGFSGTPFSGSQNFALTIVPPLAITAMSLPGGIVGQPYSTALVATGGIVPINWSLTSGALPAGLFLNAATGVISGTAALSAQGTATFTIRAIDSAGVASSAPFQVNMYPPPVVIQNSSLTPSTEGIAYGATFAASGGTPPYSWSASGLPSWLTLSAAGQLSGTPPLSSAGLYTFTISAQDGASRFAGVSFTLQVNPGPPSIATTSPLPHAKETTQVNIAFQVSGGLAPYTWAATGLPAFLNLSSAGLLNGTPPVGSSTGSVSFSVTVTDATGKIATGTFKLLIDPVLSITTSSSLQPVEGQSFSATFNASGGTTPYSFSATGLPAWASMSPGGVVGGTPSRRSAGGSAFSVTASDAAGHTSSAPFTLTVLAPNGGLTITTPSPLPIASVGNYYQSTLGATGGTPPYRWSGSGIPDGLTLGSAGLLSGTPSTAGDDTITAQVSDSNGNVVFQALGLRVTAATPRIVTPSPLAAGEVSVSYSVAFQSDGRARPLVWSTSGPLPAGMTFDANGLLSGTPTAPGDFVFTVRVSDSTGAIASAPYEVLVRPFGPDLLVSAGGLAFTAVRGAAPPPVQTFSVISTMHDSIPFTASADAPWITAAASGATPGRIDVSVDPAGLAAGSYAGTITVSSPNRTARLIKVALTVKDAPGILQASPAALDFFSDGTSASPSQNIYVHNSGQGSLDFTVSTDVPWLSVSPTSGTVSPNIGAILVAAIDTAERFAPGVSGNIEIDSASGTVRIPVSLLISAKPRMVLSAAGILLQARQGNGVSGASPATFTVSNANSDPIDFIALQIGGEGWLQTRSTKPGTLSFTATTAGLERGAYYALIRVASDAFNSPQDFVVVLNVTDAAGTPVPDPVPSGLVFTSSGNQNVTAYTSSDQLAPYQVAVSTQTGTGWLSVSPTSGTLSTTAPAQLTIAVNGANLKPGIYSGSVHISISNLAVRTVNVTFIVPALPSEAGMAAALADTPRATCAPARLVVTPTNLAGNFSTPAAWPRSVAVQVADDCGNSVPSGRVVAEFSNGDPPLSLNLSDNKTAVYSSTWTPTHAATQITVTANATASGLQPASAQILGAVSDTAAPVLAKNGTLHNLYPQPGAPLAPGTIVQIFGSGLAATTGSTNVPLPTVLNGTSVLIGGELAPLYFVSSGQINAQIPVDLIPGQEYQVLVVANDTYTTPDAIHIAPVTPGIARLANGQVIAQHADFSLVTEDAPAKPGEFLVAYLAGMGLTDNPVGTGAEAPSSPLAAVNASASVAVDGKAAPVLFAGLTPGFIGLYQINFQVPADAWSGDRKLEIFQGGMAANTSVLPVQ